MIHYAFQSQLSMQEIEDHLSEVGIKSFMDFENDKDGLYFVSTTTIDNTSLSVFSAKELVDELASRNIHEV